MNDSSGPERPEFSSEGTSGDSRETCPCMEGLEWREDGTFINPFHYAGGDGTSPEEAVIVLGIDNPMIFVRGLHLWIHERYPGWRILDRRNHDGLRGIAGTDNHYLGVSAESRAGERREFVFDDSVLVACSPKGGELLPAAGPNATYSEICERLASGNLAINFTRLRASFAESAGYDPDDRDLGNQIISMLKASAGEDWQGVLAGADVFLRKCKASPFAYALASLAHLTLGDEERGTFHKAMADGLFAAVLGPRDGRSYESAIEVLFIFEEYQILNMWGLRFTQQEFRREGGRFFDVMRAETGESGEEHILYFDVTKMVERRDHRLRPHREKRSD